MSNNLNQEALDEFQRIYKKEYGVDLSNRKVREYADHLITLVKTVYGDNLRDITNAGTVVL